MCLRSITTIVFILLYISGICQQRILIIHAYSSKSGRAYLLQSESDRYLVKEAFGCKFGLGGIGKQRVNDKKTPLGHYQTHWADVKNKKIKRYLESFGGYFLPIDYPNSCDNNLGRTGSAIGLHGGLNRNTNGCIRIIDKQYQRVNQTGIETVVDFARRGTDVVITDYLPSGLITSPQRYLSREASDYWEMIISSRRCYAEMIQLLKRFSEKKPHTASKPSLAGLGNLSLLQSNQTCLAVIDEDDKFTHIRKAQSERSESLGIVYRNETFVYTSTASDWTSVTSQKNIEGFMRTNKINTLVCRIDGIAQIDDPDGFTFIRTHPSKEAKVIGKVFQGEEFWYKIMSDDWWKVTTKYGKQGYMHKSRISPGKKGFVFTR